jgi:putative SOS response-associated peptidase YedK
LFFFAGVWTNWTGTRGTKAEPVEGEHQLCGFVTTDSNAEVKPIHKEAMPVILTTSDEVGVWLHAPGKKQKNCNGRPWMAHYKTVARGKREDS